MCFYLRIFWENWIDPFSSKRYILKSIFIEQQIRTLVLLTHRNSLLDFKVYIWESPTCDCGVPHSAFKSREKTVSPKLLSWFSLCVLLCGTNLTRWDPQVIDFFKLTPREYYLHYLTMSLSPKTKCPLWNSIVTLGIAEFGLLRRMSVYSLTGV